MGLGSNMRVEGADLAAGLTSLCHQTCCPLPASTIFNPLKQD